ncbi:hypothetical protein P153DRAFT_401235 [Dothidotthia symphoricarpi CBS 119687]|uniref:CFEM domain-containing protein n=1 Tax=Dothidotthia symphoricarpi CBS 119687 TaxID=1392245 RepID=A0A6A5ZZ23_9PLEO|nr:uncharacterized protein P153DRAFT_401235 [Dothidotthia symphoricarpi CBS 119687]KAF2124133.1 hypothetical protein P153DRAFT_401235 [Dothidotthia symphoricarpi CBS 119687]
MKTSAILSTLTLFFASSVSAQAACDAAAAAIPACGASCISTAAGAQGCPTVASDYTCLCAHEAAIETAARSCVLTACGFLEALNVQSKAKAVCDCVNGA